MYVCAAKRHTRELNVMRFHGRVPFSPYATNTTQKSIAALSFAFISLFFLHHIKPKEYLEDYELRVLSDNQNIHNSMKNVKKKKRYETNERTEPMKRKKRKRI